MEQAPPLQRIVSQEEMEPMNPVYQQDEAMINLWVDAHQLKKIEGTWYKEGRRVVTGNEAHKRTFIHDHHDTPTYGHPRINKTYQLTSRRYWWPNMCQDITNYVKGCMECQKNKVNT